MRSFPASRADCYAMTAPAREVGRRRGVKQSLETDLALRRNRYAPTDLDLRIDAVDLEHFLCKVEPEVVIVGMDGPSFGDSPSTFTLRHLDDLVRRRPPHHLRPINNVEVQRQLYAR